MHIAMHNKQFPKRYIYLVALNKKKKDEEK